MMKYKLQDSYEWEAEKADGTLIKAGDDLTDCVRLSFIPKTEIPRHDFVGLKMERRFARGFLNGMGGGMKDYYHVVVCENHRVYIRSSDGLTLSTPKDYELYI